MCFPLPWICLSDVSMFNIPTLCHYVIIPLWNKTIVNSKMAQMSSSYTLSPLHPSLNYDELLGIKREPLLERNCIEDHGYTTVKKSSLAGLSLLFSCSEQPCHSKTRHLTVFSLWKRSQAFHYVSGCWQGLPLSVRLFFPFISEREQSNLIIPHPIDV